jgi:hypothetical protein
VSFYTPEDPEDVRLGFGCLILLILFILAGYHGCVLTFRSIAGSL